ncbi:MAG TPA: SAM-dependent methyltransferase [Vicinamibacterales bacterium]|jgi:SAM-dependent MidA family methyltransferase
MNALRTLISDRIRSHGPISVAEYIDLALYHPSHGYYACASRRTGRAGDFLTSVDVGPIFGALLARQFAEMWQILESQITKPEPRIPNPEPRLFHLVEAAAGDGRLARDILDAAAGQHADLYASMRLHLIDASTAARAAQVETLGPHVHILASSSDALPDSVEGAIFANELLDALPTHAVVMRKEGLREMFVDVRGDELVPHEATPSTPALANYLDRAGVRLKIGWRAEINLRAIEWVRRAARVLRRGFLVLIDYGHEAAELYSATHAAGTLATFHRHVSSDWHSLLEDPGERDITAHVDLSTVTRVCEEEGLVTLGRLDQTYFLLGLGLGDMLGTSSGSTPAELKTRLAFKTLMLPGGLGSTLKVLIFGKDVGVPALQGLSYGGRLT